MAEILVYGTEIHVRLSRLEKAGALHRDLHIPLEEVTASAYVDDLWAHLRGLRAPGTGIPGLIMLGTTRGRGYRDFNVVYGRRSGMILTLSGSAMERVLVTGPRVEVPASRAACR
jgi:hypothetical protein